MVGNVPNPARAWGTYGVTFATSVKSSNARKVLDFVGGFMYKLRCFLKGKSFIYLMISFIYDKKYF